MARIWLTDVLLVVVLLTILVLVIFSREPLLGLTYDSYDYISASENIKTYLTGRNPDGFPYLVRAPILPGYLHFFEDKILAGTLLNCVSFAITLIISLKLGRIFQLHDFYLYLYIVYVTFTYSFLQCHLFLWSEPLFISITLLVFYCIIENIRLSLIIPLLILAFSVRKAGGFICLATIIIFFTENKFRQGLITALVMGAIFIFWEIINIHLLDYSTSGNTWSNHINLSRLLYIDSLSSWMLPKAIPLVIRAILLIGIFGLLFLVFRQVLINFSREPKQKLLFIFWFVYVISLFIFWGAPDFEEADRYLVVILPLFMLTWFSLLTRISEARVLSKWVLYILTIVWSAYPISLFLSQM